MKFTEIDRGSFGNIDNPIVLFYTLEAPKSNCLSVSAKRNNNLMLNIEGSVIEC